MLRPMNNWRWKEGKEGMVKNSNVYQFLPHNIYLDILKVGIVLLQNVKYI